MEIRIKENSLLAKIAAVKLNHKQCAITWGKTIHLHNTSGQEFLKNTAWLKHELKHIEQWHQKGSFIFLTSYLWYSILYGYYNNPYEIEARKAETANTDLDPYTIKKKLLSE